MTLKIFNFMLNCVINKEKKYLKKILVHVNFMLTLC